MHQDCGPWFLGLAQALHGLTLASQNSDLFRRALSLGAASWRCGPGACVAENDVEHVWILILPSGYLT